MSAEQILKNHFETTFNFSEDTIRWLLSLWNVTQVFDDVADGDSDKIERKSLDAAIWDSLTGFYDNPFFTANSQVLIPQLSLFVLKWKASDTLERKGQPSHMAFVWRAGYYDLVLSCVQLEHGTQAAMEHAHLVAQLYGESFEEYLEEFS